MNAKDGRYGLDSYDLGYEPAVGSCEHGNISFGFINGREFLDQPNNCQLFKTHCLPLIPH
jgi:hypothetical protein